MDSKKVLNIQDLYSNLDQLLNKIYNLKTKIKNKCNLINNNNFKYSYNDFQNNQKIIEHNIEELEYFLDNPSIEKMNIEKELEEDEKIYRTMSKFLPVMINYYLNEKNNI